MDFAGRSIHGVPRYARQQAEHPVLLLEGDVRAPRSLNPVDLAELPRHPFLEQYHNPDNLLVPASNWSGMTLRAIIDLAEPSPEAGWIHVSAGPYATVVAMADADAVLLCDGLDDAPIPAERGGPWRLVKPDDRYFTSVKWVDRITVSIERPDNSSERIAQARQRARDANA
jgi:DMSO/TMAO reductase YedYZ molybdopterin-dependent catalytic subunit